MHYYIKKVILCSVSMGVWERSVVVNCGVGQLEMQMCDTCVQVALLSTFIFWIQVEASTEAKRKDEVHTTVLVNLYECKRSYEAIEISV